MASSNLLIDAAGVGKTSTLSSMYDGRVAGVHIAKRTSKTSPVVKFHSISCQFVNDGYKLSGPNPPHMAYSLDLIVLYVVLLFIECENFLYMTLLSAFDY